MGILYSCIEGRSVAGITSSEHGFNCLSVCIGRRTTTVKNLVKSLQAHVLIKCRSQKRVTKRNGKGESFWFNVRVKGRRI